MACKAINSGSIPLSACNLASDFGSGLLATRRCFDLASEAARNADGFIGFAK
jgi:hypothetical protein